MLLRSLTKHVRDQNWFAVGLDFFIVVVGILIAFQITNWSEARSERQLESDYMALLVRDLKAIEVTVKEQISKEQEVVENAKIALKVINNRRTGLDTLDLGHSLISSFGRRTLILDSPVFSEMKSAGRLTLIQDPTLRNRIITYFDGLNRVERIVENNNEFFAEPYTAFLRDSGLGFVVLPEQICASSNVNDACQSSRLVSSVFGSEQTHAATEVFDVAAEDPLWANMRSHVVWRALAAHAGIEQSYQVLNDTKSLLELVEDAQ